MKETEKAKAHMVVGAAGMIGGALARCLRASAERVLVADLWRDGLSQEKIYLNLASDPSVWVLPDFIKTVYICSGISRIEECRKDPVGTSRVNVEGTLRLVDLMIEKGVFVVFLSSSQVFDGTIPMVPAHHPQNPQSEYGRQKTAVEKYLRQWPEQTAIVRMTKVIGPDSIFSEWAKSLRSELTIRPFTNMVLSPVTLNTVVSILSLVGNQQLGGFWQISGERDISYYDAAIMGGKLIDANLNLIKPWTVAEADWNLETNPVNTTMSIERLRKCFGLESTTISWTLSQAFLPEQ